MPRTKNQAKRMGKYGKIRSNMCLPGLIKQISESLLVAMKKLAGTIYAASFL